MNGYEKSVALNLSGTAAEKVAVLQTLAIDDITRLQLGRWLREAGLLSSTGTEWYGTLQQAIDAGAIASELLTGINDLKSILTGIGGDGLATTHPHWAGVVWDLITQLTAGDNDLITSFYAMAEGRPYADLTVEQYEAQQASAEAAAAKADLVEYLAALKQSFDAKYNVALSDIALGNLTTNQQLISAVQVGV